MKSHFLSISPSSYPAPTAPAQKPDLRPVPSAPATQETRQNWSRNEKLKGIFYKPQTVKELQEIVRFADNVRILGTAYSFTDILQAEKKNEGKRVVYVDMTELNKVLEINPPRPGSRYGTVKVQGGATIDKINQHLDLRGFALRSAPTIEEVTAAGAIATGSHGTRLHEDPNDPIQGDEGPLSDEVVSMEVMDAKGTIHTFEDPEAFAALGLKLKSKAGINPKDIEATRLHLGALGVVTSLTFKTVPAYNYEFQQEKVPETEFFKRTNLENFIQKNERCDWFWLMGKGQDPKRGTVVARKYQTSEESKKAHESSRERAFALADERSEDPSPGYWERLLEKKVLGTWVANATFRVGGVIEEGIPSLKNPYNQMLSQLARVAFPDTSFTDKSYEVTHYFPGHARVTTMEYSLPLEHAHKLPEIVRQAQIDADFVSPIGVYMRLQGKSTKTPMSLSGGRDSIILEFYSPSAYKLPAKYYKILERELSKLGGSVHHTKARAHLAKETVLPQAGRYADDVIKNFRRVAHKMDPSGKFSGEWLRRKGFLE